MRLITILILALTIACGGGSNQPASPTPPAPTAPAYTGEALLGPATDGPAKRTPLGIVYYPNGLDVPSAKRIERSIAYLRAQGVQEYQIAQFQTYARELPTMLPTWIDEAYTTIRARHVACGGKWKANAELIKPASIVIRFTATPFWSEYHKQWAASWVYQDEIKSAIVVIDGLSIGRPDLRFGKDLIRFETGNLFQRRAGEVVTGGPQELGERSPCSK